MKPIKILIVEDEYIISEKLAHNLKGTGYIVLNIVRSGEEAVKEIKTETPDIIIMDIKLDGKLDGIETAKEISKTNLVPIIYLTGLTDPNTFNRAKKTSPASFLTKPYNQVDINNAIELALHNATLAGSMKSEIIETGDKNLFILNDRIFVKDSKNCFKKIEIDDIFFIEGGGSYSTINTIDGKYTTSYTLKAIEKRIDNKNLLRIHRSYLINLNKVERIIGRNHVILEIIEANSSTEDITLGPNKTGRYEKKKISIGPEYRKTLDRHIRFI